MKNSVSMKDFSIVLLSTTAAESKEVQVVINSNISVINYLRNSEVADDELHPDAFASYCVDYYYNTLKKEGLAAFVHKTKWDEDIVEIVHAGLQAMQATEHLDYFEKQMRRMKLFSKIKLNKFLDAPLGKDAATAALLADDSFKAINEDLLALNAAWLLQHPDVQVVTVEEMQTIIADYLKEEEEDKN